jgi:hypothetical protein
METKQRQIEWQFVGSEGKAKGRNYSFCRQSLGFVRQLEANFEVPELAHGH